MGTAALVGGGSLFETGTSALFFQLEWRRRITDDDEAWDRETEREKYYRVAAGCLPADRWRSRLSR